MSAVKAWLFSVIGVLALVLAVQHLGVDVVGGMQTVVHGVEHFLNQPL
jgi:hypothetical protein